MLKLVMQHLYTALELERSSTVIAQIFLRLRSSLLCLLSLVEQPLVPCLKRLKLAVRLIEHTLCGSGLVAETADLAPHILNIVQPQRNVKAFLFLEQLEIPLCFFRIALKRCDTRLELAQNILRADHIVNSALQVPLRLVLAEAIFRYARSILEYRAALIALLRHYLGYLALTDNRIAGASNAGIHEQLCNIAQARGLAVDKILALAAANAPTGNDYLISTVDELSLLLGIVEDKRDLRRRHCAA